jgi:hypothetical protein
MQRWGRLSWVEVEDRHLVAGAGQCEDEVDLRRAAHEHQPASLPPSPTSGVQDDMNGGTVDERELAQVEHD